MMCFSLRARWAALLLTLSVLLSACGYLVQPKVKTGMLNLEKGEYAIDPQHTTVLFKINHMGMSTFVGRFNKVEASLTFDPHHIENAKLSAIISVESLDVNNRDLEDDLRGSTWFDTKKYPQAFFVTTSVQTIDEKRARFIGDLTLHGKTSPIALDVTFNGGGDSILTGRYTLGFSAISAFKRSVFGMDYLIPAIADNVDVEVFAEFQKK